MARSKYACSQQADAAPPLFSLCARQVNPILRDLAAAGFLTLAHLDLLWSVTEQEGTHEGVKTHVYEGLANLVAIFDSEQVCSRVRAAAAMGTREASISAPTGAQLAAPPNVSPPAPVPR